MAKWAVLKDLQTTGGTVQVKNVEDNIENDGPTCGRHCWSLMDRKLIKESFYQYFVLDSNNQQVYACE